jgi:predicted RNA-binding protein with RPS1 domain
MDVKEPMPLDVVVDALALAKAGRRVILDEMETQASLSVLGGLRSRPQPKESAPRVEIVYFDPQRKRDLIGPGGIVLRQMEDRFGCSLDLTQEGQCLIFGANRKMVAKCRSTVMDLVSDVVEGSVYTGTVVQLHEFGAILELLRNKEGLLHFSEMFKMDTNMIDADGFSASPQERLTIGQEIEVMCIGVDQQGSISLSQKALAKRLEQHDGISLATNTSADENLHRIAKESSQHKINGTVRDTLKVDSNQEPTDYDLSEHEMDTGEEEDLSSSDDAGYGVDVDSFDESGGAEAEEVELDGVMDSSQLQSEVSTTEDVLVPPKKALHAWNFFNSDKSQHGVSDRICCSR